MTMTREEGLAFLSLLRKLGEEVEVSKEEAQVYLADVEEESFYIPQVSGSFYIPRVPKGFYTGCFEGLRRLVQPF